MAAGRLLRPTSSFDPSQDLEDVLGLRWRQVRQVDLDLGSVLRSAHAVTVRQSDDGQLELQVGFIVMMKTPPGL